MELIDNKVIEKFTGVLKDILELELKAGNRIQETYEGDWPLPNSIMIFLDKPFKSQIQRNLKSVEFHNINDPHYWKAEYFDSGNKQFYFVDLMVLTLSHYNTFFIILIKYKGKYRWCKLF